MPACVLECFLAPHIMRRCRPTTASRCTHIEGNNDFDSFLEDNASEASSGARNKAMMPSGSSAAEHDKQLDP